MRAGNRLETVKQCFVTAPSLKTVENEGLRRQSYQHSLSILPDQN